MRLPLELAVREIALPETVEAEIRDRVDHLERFYARIGRCRVTVEGPGHHHRQGFARVRIDLTVPGAQIVVNRQSGENLAAAIREAFSAAGRRLEDYVRRVRRYVKKHEEAPRGRVSKLFREAGYGFLETPVGHEVYFHRNSVADPGFDQLEVGAIVRYAEEEGEEGPQASVVEKVGRR